MTRHSTPVAYPAALAVLLLASTLGVMAGAIVMPVLEVIRNDLDVDGTAAGLVITAHGLAIALFSPLIGRAIDRWGVRLPMAAGLVLYGLAGGAGTVLTSYPLLIASRLMLGVGAAAVFSGTTVAMLTLYRDGERDRVMGWRTTATTLGGLVWPLLGGALGGLSWHATFAIYLIGIPLGVATLVTLPDEAAGQDRQAQPEGGAVRMLRRYPALLAWYGLMLTTGLLMYSLAVFIPQRLAELGVHEPLRVSLFMVAMSIAAGVVGLAYGRLRARLDYAAMLRITAACWVAAFGVLGTVGVPAILLVAAALFGFANGLLLPTITVLIGETPPAEQRGRATSLSATAMFIGQFASPLLFGPLMGAVSISTGYLVAAGLSSLILVLLLASTVRDPDVAVSSTRRTREPAAAAACDDDVDRPTAPLHDR
ncbi:Predicted arabinose efflux permease, MFS family [Haloechinothrix alba]|uniref:Predicted arabinose efflux permease, MFS family n=1 Tax=Haloechinothrix alba TaxID=664784 RepID=A0A238VQ51_9PSEU|nr:MFS transporter [Haloechinothrix alba]SNR36311.1 Predicted arabinose efflux permease, MFS family [Haloechinothrix alba]